jgi:hypothetical protein
MSTLIIFFSLNGHNRDLAKKKAEKEEADILEFVPGGFLRIFNFLCRRRLAKRAKKIDTNEYNKLVLFGPIWWGKPAPAFMELMKNIDLAEKEVEINITQTAENEGIEELVRETILKRNGDIETINFIMVEEKQT